MKEAHETNDIQVSIDKAIFAALPEQEGKLYKQVFNLCRYLKAIPGISDKPADELLPFVKQWYTAALSTGFIDTEPFLETRIHFVLGWDKVNIPALELSALMEIADENCEQVYGEVGIDRLLSFCRELQKRRGEKSFFLGCRTACNLLGVCHKTANRWLCFLEHEGHLQLIERGSKATGKANEYLCLGGKKE